MWIAIAISTFYKISKPLNIKYKTISMVCVIVFKLFVLPRDAGTYLTKNLNFDMILKWQNQTKIIKKSVFSFWLHNITIWCKHIHGLELFTSYDHIKKPK